MRPFLTVLACAVLLIRPNLAKSMEVDFSWDGLKGCVTLFPNPEIRLRDVPPNATRVLLTLWQAPEKWEGKKFQFQAMASCHPAAFGRLGRAGQTITNG